MRKIREIIGLAGTAWCLLGVSLLIVVAFELMLRGVFFAKDTWIDGPVGEYSTPWASDFWREYSVLGTERRSYVEWRRKPFQGKQVNIDSNGIRRTWTGPETSSKESSHPYRIFVFGGSTVWGTGARDEATIPSFLAKHLVAKGLSVEVVNFGETGYVTTQELVTLILCLQRGDLPDLVVFYDGLNDAFSTFQNHVAGRPQYVEIHRVKLNLNLYLGQFSSDFAGLDRLAKGVNRRLERRKATVREDKAPPTNEVALASDTIRVYEQNLRLIQSLADAYGFKCQFFWQPVVFTKHHLTEFESRAAGDMEFYRSFCLEVYRQAAASEFLAQQGRFHNISSIFDETSEQCYLDFAHVTEEANEMIAKDMEVYLAPEIKR